MRPSPRRSDRLEALGLAVRELVAQLSTDVRLIVGCQAPARFAAD